MSNPTVSLESREAVFSAMILQCYICMGASPELCSQLHTPCQLLETQSQLAQNFYVTFSVHPIQKKPTCSMHVEKNHTLNFEQCTFSPVCSMISHVFIEEYLARQQFEILVWWNVIPINCTILWTAPSDHFFTARGSMKVSRSTCFSGSFVNDQACIRKKVTQLPPVLNRFIFFLLFLEDVPQNRLKVYIAHTQTSITMQGL